MNRLCIQDSYQNNICKVCLMVFVIYTQYFQYVVRSISNMVMLLGALTIGICFLCWISMKVPWSEFSSNELNLYIIFWIFTLFTGLVCSENSSVHLKYWTTSFTYFLLIPCILIAIYSYDDILKCLRFYAVFSVLIAITLIIHPVLYRDTSSVLNMRYSLSTSLNVNMLGLFLTIGCWCLLITMVLNNTMHFISIVSLVILIYGLFLTGSRKSIIALGMVGILWLFWVWIPDNQHNAFKILAVLLVLAIVGYFVYSKYYIGSVMNARMDSMLFGTSESNSIRVQMYKDAWQMFKERPLMGWGFHGYGLYMGDVQGYSHATYVEVPACTGLFGSVLFFAMYLTSIRKCYTLLKYTKGIEELRHVTILLKMNLVLWAVIIFLSTCMIFIYELMCFIIIGFLFAVARYCKNTVYDYYES